MVVPHKLNARSLLMRWLVLLVIWLQLTLSLAAADEKENCFDPSNKSLFCKGIRASLRRATAHSENDYKPPRADSDFHKRPIRPHPSDNVTTIPQETLDSYKILARLQYISYCDANITTWTCGICQDQRSPVKNTTSVSDFATPRKTGFGMVGVSHDLQRIFIAFQGAIHRQEWIRAFQFFKVSPREIGVNRTLGIKVHRGFYRSYREVRAQVSDLLLEKKQLYPRYKLLILGHSYGGALASLLALDIAQGYLRNVFRPRDVEMMTFGQPRVGNQAYADAINTAGWIRNLRLVHSTDIFVHLPLRKVVGFVHHKGEIWLNPDTGEWHDCDGAYQHTAYKGESFRCANSVRPWEFTTAAHISYTTKRAFQICPYDPMKDPIDVEYLPNYAVDM